MDTSILVQYDSSFSFFFPITTKFSTNWSKTVRNGGDLVEERILNESIVEIGYKKSASDGLICSSSGKMFLTGIETNTVYQV